jgi:hypothetical protein
MKINSIPWMCPNKKCDDKEMKCHYCNTLIKPIIERNIFEGWWLSSAPAFGRVRLGITKDKKYMLICPNCKAVLGTK